MQPENRRCGKLVRSSVFLLANLVVAPKYEVTGPKGCVVSTLECVNLADQLDYVVTNSAKLANYTEFYYSDQYRRPVCKSGVPIPFPSLPALPFLHFSSFLPHSFPALLGPTPKSS